MALHIHQFICLEDNFCVLVHDPDTKRTLAIDAPDAAAIQKQLREKNWSLTDLWITHHHADHIQGVAELRKFYPDLRIAIPEKEENKIVSIIGTVEKTLKEDSEIDFGGHRARIIETPGHTLGSIVYYFEQEDVAFVGDTLFSLGCGRVLETSLAVMWHSLSKLAVLPEETQIFCGHEYTQSNAKFALAVEPENVLLIERAAKVVTLRNANKAALPTTIRLELATNPFLRCEEAELQQAMGMLGADPSLIFAQLRQKKDNFR